MVSGEQKRAGVSRTAGSRARGVRGLRPSAVWDAARRRSSRGRKVLICADCELTGRAMDEAEARYLIGVHHRLHHGRMPRPASESANLWRDEQGGPQ